MIEAQKNYTFMQQSGNAMIYVLLAIALLGFLTVTLSRQNDQADGQEISDEFAELYANELMEYAAAAENVVNMMIATGTDVSELDFVIPSDAAFNAGSHIHKVFHPSGGGLNYQTSGNQAFLNITGPPTQGWYISTRSNVEWTPSTAQDVILTSLYIDLDVCKKINKQITGEEVVYEHGAGATSTRILFANFAATQDLDTSTCPACEGYPALCIKAPGTTFDSNGGSFYSIIAAQ